MRLHHGLIQVEKSITKVLRIVSKVFWYLVQSTCNRIELSMAHFADLKNINAINQYFSTNLSIVAKNYGSVRLHGWNFGFERGKTLKTDKENGPIISYSELVTSAISQPLRAANINCHRAGAVP